MKKRWMNLGVIAVIALLFLGACSEEKVEPQAIDESTAKCEHCNMSVLDNEFATQIVLENGKSVVFDDIGCMIKWMTDNESEEVAEAFVRDYSNKEWITLHDATYVYNEKIQTPMAYNVISFETEEAAKEFVRESGGTVLTKKELDSHDWKMNKDMMQKMKMKHDDHSHDNESSDEETDAHDMNTDKETEQDSHSHE